MQELFNRFQTLSQEYLSLKQQCESEVVQWRWATSSAFELRPFYCERYRFKPGRFLKTKPASIAGKYEYGYDRLGRVVVGRKYVEIKIDSQDSYYENFYIYKEDAIESALFSYHSRKDPINCQRFTYKNDRLILSEFYATRGATVERYSWEADKLVSISIESAEIKDPHTFVEPVLCQKIEPKYDTTGIMNELIQYYDFQSNGSAKILTLYQKLDRKQSFQQLLNRARDLLISNIIQTLANQKLEESVYCMALTYSPGQFSSLPPYICLGLNRERENWISDHQELAKCYFWNPAEFSTSLEIQNREDLSSTFNLINQECGLNGRDRDVIKMLNEVAKFLGTYNWANILSTTSDFVVFTCDFESGEDLPNNFKYSVPSKLRQQFKKQGWLPS